VGLFLSVGMDFTGGGFQEFKFIWKDIWKDIKKGRGGTVWYKQ